MADDHGEKITAARRVGASIVAHESSLIDGVSGMVVVLCVCGYSLVDALSLIPPTGSV